MSLLSHPFALLSSAMSIGLDFLHKLFGRYSFYEKISKFYPGGFHCSHEFLCFYPGRYNNIKNANQDVELKVLGVFDEHISAAIPGKAIKTLVKQFSDVKSYPDVLFMISPVLPSYAELKKLRKTPYIDSLAN